MTRDLRNKVRRSTNKSRQDARPRREPNICKYPLGTNTACHFSLLVIFSTLPTLIVTLSCPQIAMAPKPASTASKAPHSTAATKAPTKTTEGKKAAKKTSKAPADGEKKKRKKTRKETYSSYIYKGTSATFVALFRIYLMRCLCSAEAGTP
jgi:hypothetical protein